MPSSTSSFERRVPAGDRLRVWLVALVLAACATGWCEHVARRHRQRPSVTDDAAWWGVHRAMVDDDPRAVAFVGTSRMELAYSATAFAAAAPEFHGVQLAINGMLGLAPFADLANDARFHGTAVVDVAEWELGRPDAFTSAAAYVERSHAEWRAPGALANRYLATVVQAHLAVLAVGGRELIAGLLGQHRWPDPKWAVGDRDRTMHGDYSLADAPALEKRRDKAVRGVPDTAPSPDAWLAVVARLDALVTQVHAHGGEVVFVRLPVTGRLAEITDARYPRARYWDVFAAHTKAVTIHFRDVPALAGLACPDFMHLDQKDQAAFTTALVAALRERGVLIPR